MNEEEVKPHRSKKKVKSINKFLEESILASIYKSQQKYSSENIETFSSVNQKIVQFKTLEEYRKFTNINEGERIIKKQFKMLKKILPIINKSKPFTKKLGLDYIHCFVPNLAKFLDLDLQKNLISIKKNRICFSKTLKMR